MSLRALALVTALLCAGCWPSSLERLDSSSGCDPAVQSCPTDLGACAAVSFAGTIQPFLDSRCGGCHNGDAPMNVGRSGAYASLMQAPTGQKCGAGGAGPLFSASWRRVVPYDLTNSVLWWYLQDCCAPTCGSACGPLCVPMCSQATTRCGNSDPLCGSARPSDTERSNVQCWILAGAPNN